MTTTLKRNTPGEAKEPTPRLHDIIWHVGVRIEEWPPHIANPLIDRCKLGYHARRHESVSRHPCFVFLVHNGAPPDVVIRWLHMSGRVASDALPELIDDLRNMQRGTYRSTTTDLGGDYGHQREVRAELPERMIGRVEAAVAYANAHKTCRPRTSGADVDPLAQYARARASYFGDGFPFELVCMLLHRPGSPFQLREVTCGKEQPIHRSRPILSLGALKWAARTRTTSLHAGVAFRADTQEPRTEPADALGTELVIEIDEPPRELAHLTRDLADPQQNDGRLWWRWVAFAVDLMVAVLTEMHVQGRVEQIFCFASGGKSPHLWLLDPWIAAMNAEARADFVASLDDPTSQPWWQEVYRKRCVPFYEETLLLPVEQGGFGLAKRPRTEREIAALTFPRFDKAVAVEQKHTHRMPLSIHDTTARIAIPFTRETIPTRTTDMPRIDDPQLHEKLSGPLDVLRRAVAQLADGSARLGPLQTDVEEADDASWVVARAHKRILREMAASTPGPAPSAKRARTYDESVTTRGLPVFGAATKRLRDDLVRHAANERLARADLPPVLKAICSGKAPEKWRSRLRHEAKRLDVLLAWLGETDGEKRLEGKVVHDDAGGRMRVFHPELDQLDFVKTVHGATRHTITQHRLLELDISGAHPSAAWAACRHAFGADAERRCPSLALYVRSRSAAIRQLRSQYAEKKRTPPNEGDAKVRILAALNQHVDDETHAARVPFIKSLVRERADMETALLGFPLLRDEVAAIKAKAATSGKATTLLALLMQGVEDKILRLALPRLADLGWALVAPISDAVLLEQTSEASEAPSGVADAAENARDAMEAVARDAMVTITVKIDHVPQCAV